MRSKQANCKSYVHYEIQAARAIRSSIHPLAVTIPIIAMTANAFSEDIHDCLEAGMNAHVSKPIDMTVFEQTVQRVLGLESVKQNVVK